MKWRVYILVTLACFVFQPVAYGITKAELESQIRERLTDKEYEMIEILKNQTGKAYIDVFDEYIEPMRTEQLKDVLRKKYIQPSKKEFDRRQKEEAEKIKNKIDKVQYVDDEKPVSIQRPPKKAKSKIHKSRKKYEEAKVEAAKPVKKEISKPVKAEKPKEEPKFEGKVKKRKKVLNRIIESNRAKLKKDRDIEFNKTRSKRVYGTKRIDEESEDKGYSSSGFKKKKYGSKLIENSEDKGFNSPGFKEKTFGPKAIEEPDAGAE